MSADNWAACPRCLQQAKETAEEAKREVDALYGQIPVEEFEQRRADLPDLPDAEDNKYRTFREDYEWWTEGGKVEWNYHGKCTICGLECKVDGSKRFWDSIAREPVDA